MSLMEREYMSDKYRNTNDKKTPPKPPIKSNDANDFIKTLFKGILIAFIIIVIYIFVKNDFSTIIAKLGEVKLKLLDIITILKSLL